MSGVMILRVVQPYIKLFTIKYCMLNISDGYDSNIPQWLMLSRYHVQAFLIVTVYA